MNTTRTLLLTFAAAACITACSPPTQQVQTGELVLCRVCRKEIANTVAVITVPVAKAKDYAVKRSESWCQPCGEQPVSFTTTTKCTNCGRVETKTQTAPRNTEPKDQLLAVKVCQCGEKPPAIAPAPKKPAGGSFVGGGGFGNAGGGGGGNTFGGNSLPMRPKK